ncbi:MAG: amino acid ABC transporter permease [Hominilimicola sp.]|uniref:amino acid ABC transporter permease n=1 Tax=Hominilimicola sp. TaxID=3073571 RepID=UPI003999EB11
MPAWVVDLLNRLNSTFVVDGRWQWFVSGLGYTLLISLFSVLLGLVIGILMALMRLSKSKILRAVSGIYIDIIRGTPTMVQLLIIYLVIFANVHIDKWVVGFIAFGINSGAYIAEIVRGGILSVNIGQTEAGRSLGMTHKQTMASIVMPQAMKNILPALGNEFVVLIKETAVIGMIANIDLVGAARKVQSLTYDYLIPLLSIAVIYYVVIKIISTLLSKVEKGMRKADKR